MIMGLRIRNRMAAMGLSQAELARRVGITQPSIFKLITSNKTGSAHLHRIARELATTPAYLAGETDDPSTDAPPPQPVPRFQHVTLAVALPSTPALTEAFGAILKASRDLSEDELARELARRLPIVLRAAAAGALSSVPADDDAFDEPAEDQASALPPARRAAGR